MGYNEVQTLYMHVYGSGAFTKSLPEFMLQMADPTYRQKVFEHITSTGDFTQTFADFEDHYSLPLTDTGTTVSGTDGGVSYVATDHSNDYYKDGVGWFNKPKMIEVYNKYLEDVGLDRKWEYDVENGKVVNLRKGDIDHAPGDTTPVNEGDLREFDDWAKDNGYLKGGDSDDFIDKEFWTPDNELFYDFIGDLSLIHI